MAEPPMPPLADLTAAQIRRWNQMLGCVTSALSPGPRMVVVDGHVHAAAFADRLAHALAATGQDSIRLTDMTPAHDEDAWWADRGPRTLALADGARWRAKPLWRTWDVVIWLRTPPPAGAIRDSAEHGAQIVIDMHDPTWPVVRHIDRGLADCASWHASETQAFFAARAHLWDAKFGDDVPAYAAAIGEFGAVPGGVAVDVGCGTGRALPALRVAVGGSGAVIGLDFTKQMIAAARSAGHSDHASLMMADASRLPLADAKAHLVFAAGLINHVPDVDATLAELARITADGGRLGLFHPSGRAALAARHGRALRPDEPLAEAPLREALACIGWRLDSYDDSTSRFFARATRMARPH